MFLTYILPVLIFAGLGIIAGVLLTVVSKLFEVKTDERLEALSEALPQINCGACGYSGCNSYAEAVLNGAPTNMCTSGGSKTAAALSEIMGVAAGEVVAKVAFIKCGGDCHATNSKFIFEGTQSCAAANRFYSGSELCINGCLGFGDCLNVCPNGAIEIKDRLAKVNISKCLGCGLCTKACPNSLIIVKPISNIVSVRCSSIQSGKITKSICKNGCIGCKICEKKCPEGAIKVENNLASIDYSKCTSCGTCVASCPTGAISTCKS